MKQTDGAKKQLELLLQRYPILAGQRDEIDGAYQILSLIHISEPTRH